MKHEHSFGVNEYFIGNAGQIIGLLTVIFRVSINEFARFFEIDKCLSYLFTCSKTGINIVKFEIYSLDFVFIFSSIMINQQI